MEKLSNEEIFANNLKYYMKLNNITRYRLCCALEVTYTTLAGWCLGTSYPRIERIEELANFFGIRKSDLIEDKNELAMSENKIPIFDTSKSKSNFLNDKNIIGYTHFDRENSDLKNYIAIKVTDSNMEPIIYKDDIIIVHKQNNIKNGQIALVLVNNTDLIISKVVKYKNFTELISFNPYYPSKKLNQNNYKIIGKITEAKISKIFE